MEFLVVAKAQRKSPTPGIQVTAKPPATSPHNACKALFPECAVFFLLYGAPSLFIHSEWVTIHAEKS